jgi:hypothetical protein
MFKQLDNKLVIAHFQRHFKQTCPLSFDCLFSINDDLTVYCTNTYPIQFKFGKVNDMLTFYDKQDKGWNNIHINKYFKQKKLDDASGGVQQMTTSQQFEEVCIQFETMHQIKVEKNSKEYKFSINVCWKIIKRIIQLLEQDIKKCSSRTHMNLNQSRNWY